MTHPRIHKQGEKDIKPNKHSRTSNRGNQETTYRYMYMCVSVNVEREGKIKGRKRPLGSVEVRWSNKHNCWKEIGHVSPFETLETCFSLSKTHTTPSLSHQNFLKNMMPIIKTRITHHQLLRHNHESGWVFVV